MTAATPEALRALLRAEDFDGALRLCADAGGDEVRTLRAALDSWLEAAREAARRETRDGERTTLWHDPQVLDGSAQALRIARACRFALHDAEQVRRNGLMYVVDDEDAARVARARGRRWASSIAAAFVEQWSGGRAWALVRPWIRAGLCDRPEGDGYVRSLMGLWPPRGRTLRDPLLDDPDLLDDEVWRLFEVEGGGESSLAARDKFERVENSWSTVLASFAAEGRLSRDRLLDATLAALARDWAQFRAGWFSRFHDTLGPTDDEMAARADRYLRLLGSRIGPTVSLALRCVRRLDRLRRIPAESLLAAAPDVLRSRTKATVLAMLRLLDGVARREPAKTATVARLAADALVHESSEVQSAALDVISRHGHADDTDLRAAVTRHSECVSATLRGRLAPFLTGSVAGEAAGAFDADRPTAPEPGDESPLAASRRLEPIAGLADAVEVLSRVVEDFDSDEFERALDAVVRLGRPSAAAEEKLAAPLARRAARCGERSVEGSLVAPVATLAATWAGGCPWTLETPLRSRPLVFSDPDYRYQAPMVEAALRLPGGAGAPPTLYDGEPLQEFLAGRLGAVAALLLEGRRAALLSTPTHRGGWIDPVVLAERVLAGEAIDDDHDRVLALLRLAPDGREEALRRLRGVPGEFAAALRHALGAEDGSVGRNAALWIAAARARSPFDDDPKVGRIHAGLGPDAAEAARYELPSLPPPPPEALPYPFAPTFVVRTPWPPRPVSSSHLAVLAHVRPDRYDRTFERSWLAWWATAWPSNHEALFALGIERLLRGSEVGDQVPEFVAPLCGPHVRWEGLGAHLLAIALGAPSPDVAQAAIDALVEAVSRGRLTPDRLGEAVAWTVATRRVPCRRFARSLGQVAVASPRHAAFAADVAEASLRGDTRKGPRDLLALLELLLELRTRGGGRVAAPDAREFLAAVTGGRTARVAAALLAL